MAVGRLGPKVASRRFITADKFQWPVFYHIHVLYEPQASGADGTELVLLSTSSRQWTQWHYTPDAQTPTLFTGVKLLQLSGNCKHIKCPVWQQCYDSGCLVDCCIQPSK